MASTVMASKANSGDVVAAITMHRQEHKDDSSPILCGFLVINPKNIQPEDYEDTGCQLLLTTACAHAHEASILKRAEGKLTEVQKANTVAMFFEAEDDSKTPLVSRKTYDDILMKIALAISQEDEARVVNSDLVFNDGAAMRACHERARNMSLYEMIASLIKARLDFVRVMHDTQLKLVKKGKEWTAKVNMIQKLLERGRKEHASSKVADLRADDLRALLTPNLRQKVWMDMFGQLSPHMSALAFGADMASAEGAGFEEAKREFDDAVMVEMRQTRVVRDCEAQVAREEERLAAFEKFCGERGSEVEDAKKAMADRISSLRGELVSLRFKLSAVPADTTETTGGFLGIGATTKKYDRSGERNSYRAQISGIESQIVELEKRSENLSPATVKNDNEVTAGKIRESIAMLQNNANAEKDALKVKEEDRMNKGATYKRCREATAIMLAKSGAATKEQALASLEAAQGVSGSMQNQSVKRGLFETLSGNFADLLEAITTCQEITKEDGQLDETFFKDIVVELERSTQNPLNRMLASVVRVAPEPVEYATMISKFDPALQEKVFASKDEREEQNI